MSTVFLTRKTNFNAAHRLFVKEWSDEQNEKIFGKCANKNWHGHNFDLHVTISGTPDKQTGMLMDFKSLKDLIQQYILEKVDHRNLNIDVDFMQGIMPTAENLVVEIWKILSAQLNDCKLHCVKLYETPNNYVEYFG